MTEVRKIGAVIQVSRQTLLDYGLVEPTEDERREAEASHAEYERRRRAATTAWPLFVAQLGAITDPVARAVLDLHDADQRGECAGCEFGGYEAEPPGWPCGTTLLVAASVGLAIPPDLHMAEQAAL